MTNLLLLKKMVIKLNKNLIYCLMSTLKLITIRSLPDSFFLTLCGK